MNSKSYMSNPENVRAMIEKLGKLQIGQLRRCQPAEKTFFDYLRGDILETFSMGEEAIDKLDLMDFLCVIYQMPHYFDARVENYEMRMVEMDAMREFFLLAEENCIPIKLFLGTPIRAFYDCLESLVCDGRVKKEWEDVKKRLGDMREKRKKNNCAVDDLTMKEVFLFLGEERRRAWYPIKSLDDYMHEMTEVYNMSEKLLGKSFELAFPERFDIRDVLTKTGHKNNV